MKVVHRFPWLTPYAYTEIEIENAEEGYDFGSAATQAIEMEAAWFAAGGRGGSGHPIVEEAVRPANRPSIPQMGQERAGNDNQDGITECDRCGGPAKPGKAMQTKNGMRRSVMCAGSCKEKGKDGKFYSYTIGWEDAA